jgi:hypothetical protein
MSTYKVIQDIEAEDKLVGPLTLRQFIYAGIAAICFYLSFLALTKHVGFLAAIFLPVGFTGGFFAFPWGQDQPTEIWALAKLRFLIKPRKRIWDQSGAKDMVTVTAPKVVEHHFTNGLDQNEVQSRLSALANTIDSRGWAIKNVNVNMSSANAQTASYTSDRLINASSMPQEVSNIDVRASDDILDESSNPIAQQFDTMINASTTAHRQQIMAQMQRPTPAPAPVQDSLAPPLTAQQYYQQQSQQPQPMQQQHAGTPPPNYWFMQPPSTVPGQAQFVDAPMVTPGITPPAAPQAAMPTAEEQALVEKFKQENSSQALAYGHLKTVKTPEQLAVEAAQAAQAQAEADARAAVAAAAKPAVTPTTQAAIINLANNDDLDVATIARQANRQVENDDGEVVISLR